MQCNKSRLGRERMYADDMLKVWMSINEDRDDKGDKETGNRKYEMRNTEKRGTSHGKHRGTRLYYNLHAWHCILHTHTICTTQRASVHEAQYPAMKLPYGRQRQEKSRINGCQFPIGRTNPESHPSRTILCSRRLKVATWLPATTVVP